MRATLVLWPLMMLFLGAWDWNPLRCAEIYQKSPTINNWQNVPFNQRRPSSLTTPGRLRKQEFRLEYNESNSFQILRGINRLFVEGQRDWLIREKEYTEIAVPEGQVRWNWFFKMTLKEVVRELEQVEMYRVDFFENGLQQMVYEGKFLKGFETREGEMGEPVYVFRIDPRFIKLIELVEEPAHAAIYLESGLYKTVDYNLRGSSY